MNVKNLADDRGLTTVSLLPMLWACPTSPTPSNLYLISAADPWGEAGPDLGKSFLALGRKEGSCVPQWTVLIPETQQEACNVKLSQGKG